MPEWHAGPQGAAEKVADPLAGHVPARPTGDNLLRALREISMVTFRLAL